MNLHDLAQLASVSLLAGIWQGFLLAAAVWLCLRLVPKTTATQRFTLWSAVFLLIALLPWFERPQSAPAFQGVRAVHSALQLDPRWSLLLAVVWLVLTLFRAGDLALNALRLRSLRRRSVPVIPTAECAAPLADGFRLVQLCTSTEVDRPSVIGFFAPRILIPDWLFQQLTPSELEQIVLHEMEHLRRGDDWLNLLQKLSLVLFPLNPILLWIERRLCFERELACDDGVLRRTKAPRIYAACLASLAERGLDHRALSLALGALARQSELARRVHRILRREAVLSPLRARVVTAALTLGLLGGAAGLAHCPQLVSFAAPAPSTQAALFTSDLSPTRIPATATNSKWINTASQAVLQPKTAARSVSLEVSRSSQTAHMTLLKATMPIPSTAEQSRPVKPAHRANARTLHRIPTLASGIQRVSDNRASNGTNETLDRSTAQSWVVLTTWTEMAPSHAPAPAPTAQPILLPYAAVRVDGGWLILQL